MKCLNHHYRPLLNGTLWLFLFAVIGCTQKNCSGIKQEVCRNDLPAGSSPAVQPEERSRPPVHQASLGAEASMKNGSPSCAAASSGDANPGACIAKIDTLAVNHQRRQIITDFRDLLFMYAKTQSPREKEFFKTSAIRKIHEIPGVKMLIIPQADIYVLFKEATPVESGWTFTPILDHKRSIIIGVAVEEKKAVL